MPPSLTGSLHWKFGSKLLERPAPYRECTLRFGSAEQNQVVVPLVKPEIAATLADIPVVGQFSLESRKTTLRLLKAYVSLGSQTQPLKQGYGQLVLEVEMTNQGTYPGGVYWGIGDTYLERPDGVSVAAALNENLYPGDRVPISLIYEVIEPFRGKYTFGITNGGPSQVLMVR